MSKKCDERALKRKTERYWDTLWRNAKCGLLGLTPRFSYALDPRLTPREPYPTDEAYLSHVEIGAKLTHPQSGGRIL